MNGRMYKAVTICSPFGEHNKNTHFHRPDVITKTFVPKSMDNTYIFQIHNKYPLKHIKVCRLKLTGNVYSMQQSIKLQKFCLGMHKKLTWRKVEQTESIFFRFQATVVEKIVTSTSCPENENRTQP